MVDRGWDNLSGTGQKMDVFDSSGQMMGELYWTEGESCIWTKGGMNLAALLLVGVCRGGNLIVT